MSSGDPPDPLDVTAELAGASGSPTAVRSVPPATIGKYKLERVLGSGGMGVVWAATDPDLERAVAIKLLHAEASSLAPGADTALRSRLLREARAMARLKHPNVLTVYEVGTDGNRDYIAMELVDGDSLGGWLATKPPRAEIIAALVGAGRGLAAAHAAGLVHRDFKPHNVLRSRDGHVYVTDFGLARGQIEDGAAVEQLPLAAPVELSLASGSQPRRAMDSVLDSPLTQTGVLIGTPAYMAPEQFSGKLPDPRSDQFAFCVTAWEALAGARPFRGTTLAELESASKGGAPTTTIPITELPPAIRAVLARGLDPDPARRWPDMRTLLDALETAAAPRADRRRFVWLGVAALGVLGAGIALVIANSSSKPDDRSRVVSITRSAGPADAPRDHCDDPESAFATTWSPARRATMLRDRHPGELVGVFAILDDIRSQWTRAYRRACNAERTVEITSRLECLDSILVQIARATDRVANDPAGIADLGMLAASVMLCDPSSRNTVGEEIELSLPIPPPPSPPTTPPTAPKPPGTE